MKPLTLSSVRFKPERNWLAKLMNGAGLLLKSLKLKFWPLKSNPGWTSSSEVIKTLGTWDGWRILRKACGCFPSPSHFSQKSKLWQTMHLYLKPVIGDNPHPSHVTCWWITGSEESFDSAEGFSFFSSEILEFVTLETFFRMLSVRLGISFWTSLWTKAWTSSWEIVETEGSYGTISGWLSCSKGSCDIS